MKAFRNIGGTVTEIEVDVGIDGRPILPPDTTIDAKPADIPGFYLTVVGTAWVQIPVTVENKSFETKRQEALALLAKYRDWSTEQPVTHQTIVFDADDTARNRINQSLVAATNFGKLPQYWIAYDNSPFPIATAADLTALANTIFDAFTSRIFAADSIRQQILALADGDEAGLAAIAIPTIPTQI